MFNINNFSQKGNALRKTIEEQNSLSKELELKFLDDVLHNVSLAGKVPDSFRIEYPISLDKSIIIKTFEALSIPLTRVQTICKFKSGVKSHCYMIFTK